MKKGFTLIELLAVIVILAIIALITVPTLTKVVDSARLNAAIQSANGYIDSINTQIISSELSTSSKNINNGTYNISELDVNIKGKKPDNGIVTVDKKSVKEARFCIGKYSVDYDGVETKLSNNNYCGDTKVTILSNGKEVNYTSKGGNTYTLDLTDKTNINCNNGAVPEISGNTLTVKNALGNTTCDIGSSLKYTFYHLNDGDNNIIMVSDENLSERLLIDKGYNVVFNLNGKKVKTVNSSDLEENNANTYSQNYFVFSVYGSLIINDENNTGLIDAYPASEAIAIRPNGSVVINGGSFNGRRAINSSGNLVINDGNFTSKMYEGIGLYNNSNTIINNGTFTGFTKAVYLADAANLDINGGVIYNDYVIPAIDINSTGDLNITSLKGRVYIGSLILDNDKPFSSSAIKIYKPGNINIKGEKADKCDENVGSNTIGICLFSRHRGIVNDDLTNSSVINIDGATIISETLRAVDIYATTANIKNAYIKGNTGISCSAGSDQDKYKTALINICNSYVSGTAYDAWVTSEGYIKYNSDVKFEHNNLVDQINNPKHIVLDNSIKCTN